MAIDFLIDGAKNFGQIASDSAKNIFNGVTKDNSLLNKIGNAGAFGLMTTEAILGTDLGQIETPEMKEYLKALAINRIKETGNLSGNELGYSDYDKNAQWSTPNWNGLWSTNNVFTPNAAYANTLGAGGFNVSETGGPANFTGTNFDFKRNNGMFGLINSGGILNQDYGNNFPNYKPEKSKVTQNFTPNIEITPKDIQDIFAGGKLVHKGEGEPWKTGDSEASPEISSYNQEQAKREDIYRMQQGQVKNELPPPRPTVTKKPPPPRPTPRKSVGMMSSGPKRRSSRGVRRKPTVSAGPPNRSRIGGRYGL